LPVAVVRAVRCTVCFTVGCYVDCAFVLRFTFDLRSLFVCCLLLVLVLRAFTHVARLRIYVCTHTRVYVRLRVRLVFARCLRLHVLTGLHAFGCFVSYRAVATFPRRGCWFLFVGYTVTGSFAPRCTRLPFVCAFYGRTRCLRSVTAVFTFTVGLRFTRLRSFALLRFWFGAGLRALQLLIYARVLLLRGCFAQFTRCFVFTFTLCCLRGCVTFLLRCCCTLLPVYGYVALRWLPRSGWFVTPLRYGWITLLLCGFVTTLFLRVWHVYDLPRGYAVVGWFTVTLVTDWFCCAFTLLIITHVTTRVYPFNYVHC